MTTKSKPERGVRSRWKLAATPLAILAISAAVAFALVETGPVVERLPRARQPRLVEVTVVERSDEATEITVMGSVVATREIVIQPQVTGRIIEVSSDFIPGGRFATGDVMLRIDPSDYELAVRQLEADVAQARADLQIEQGNQSVAKLEYELLGEAVLEEDRDLVLRQPQLATMRARLASSEAVLAKSRLDLDRTWVRSPFPALVRGRGAELGSKVDPATPLATLVDTGAYWVEVLVPVSQLRWIDIPSGTGKPGSSARIVDASAWGEDAHRTGEVERLLGDLETEGRMARILVRIEDPLALEPENAGRPPLLLDSFVSVQIRGRTLEGVVALERELLRDHDRVWIMGDDGALEIRAVDVAFRGAEQVLVREGLTDGEQLVISELSSPVEGMPLRSAAESPGSPVPPADEAGSGRR